MKYPNRLLELRTSRGHTQEYIAQMVGISKSYYCKLERGQKRLHQDTLQKLSIVFGETVDSILGADEPTAQGKNTIETEWPELAALLAQCGEVTPEKKNQITQIVKLLLNENKI